MKEKEVLRIKSDIDNLCFNLGDICKLVDFTLKIMPKNKKGGYKAYREKDENSFWEHIAVYDSNNKLISKSPDHHPEGIIDYHWNGFVFMCPYIECSEERTLCHVKINDNIKFIH